MLSRLATAWGFDLLALKVAPSIIPGRAECCALVFLFEQEHLRRILRVNGSLFRGGDRPKASSEDEELQQLAPRMSCLALR